MTFSTRSRRDTISGHDDDGAALGPLYPLHRTFDGEQVGRMKIAVLDDYQNVALRMADWSPLAKRAKIKVFNDHK